MVIKPATSKGTRDFSSKEIARRNYLKSVLQATFERFSFQPIETPSFERLETLMGQYGEEGDRLIFKILNSGEKVKNADLTAFHAAAYQKFSKSLSDKALRYDLTVPFARYVSQHRNDLAFPFRRYQIQPVWRADRPQHGRFQEFFQCDADIVGDRSLWQEVEMLLLYETVFDALGLNGITLKINHRKILAGIARLIGAESQLIAFTVALDKLDKIGQEGVVKELQAKGFSQEALVKLSPLFELEGSASTKLVALEALFIDNAVGMEGIQELRFILQQIEQYNFKSASVELDLTLARGLHYYTGMIVEVAAPKEVKMGSIGGGGRYDDLTSTFGLKNMSGIGVSFGFERIYLVLETLGLFPDDIDKSTQVLMVNFGADTAAMSFEWVMKLRSQGVSCEFYPSDAKLKKQLGYANQKNIPLVVLLGSEEIERKEFVIKDMRSGEQSTHALTDLASVILNKTART